ncbi:MAG: iron-sulfur cluster assembly scaffold protein [Candidatus Rokubacteria bacterium]|nr:iron-sulfur cluster assembly scaffold protein [Candidatus Rokubacteria bacterium]
MNYSETLIDHFRNPRNAGMMRDPDGVGEDTFEGCGDLARFYLRVVDGRVADVRFQTYGCGPTIAASSAGTELASGRSVSDLLTLSERDVAAAVDGLPAERLHAAEVVAGALRAAARDYVARRNGGRGMEASRHV